MALLKFRLHQQTEIHAKERILKPNWDPQCYIFVLPLLIQRRTQPFKIPKTYIGAAKIAEKKKKGKHREIQTHLVQNLYLQNGICPRFYTRSKKIKLNNSKICKGSSGGDNVQDSSNFLMQIFQYHCILGPIERQKCECNRLGMSYQYIGLVLMQRIHR